MCGFQLVKQVKYLAVHHNVNRNYIIESLQICGLFLAQVKIRDKLRDNEPNTYWPPYYDDEARMLMLDILVCLQLLSSINHATVIAEDLNLPHANWCD